MNRQTEALYSTGLKIVDHEARRRRRSPIEPEELRSIGRLALVRVVPQFDPERGDQITTLLIDGAYATKLLVVLGDFQHPLAGNVLAAQHVLQERHDVFGALGTSEGNEQQGIIVITHSRGREIWGKLRCKSA